MASDSPPKDSKSHSPRDMMRSGIQWFKQTLKPPSSSRPHSSRSPSPTPSRASNQMTATRAISRQARDAAGHVSGTSTGGDTATLETTNSAWGGLETALQVLEKGAGVFPPLKSAISELRACLDIVKMATSSRKDHQELAAELTMTVNTLEGCMDELKLEDRNGIIARIASSIKEEVARINKHQSRGMIGRLLESEQAEEDVVRCYRLIEASFRQLQNNMNTQTLQNTRKQFEVTLLQGLSPEEDARYDSAYSMTVKRRGCTAETRERIQEGLRDWVQNPNGAKVYWVNGMAGTGKTTIAYSLCEWLEKNKRLGASFFCSRTTASCRNVNRIVPTIACQLARYSPAFRSTLCKVLEDDTGAAKLNVVQQFEKLVKAPLLEIKAAIPDGVVVVVDALDECEDTDGVRLVLATLMRLAAALPVKFFVASRPEPVIRERMLSSSDYSPFVLRLHDIEESIVEEDVKKYLKEALSFMSPPPSNQQIEQLAKRAGKLFIYAATAVRYICPSDIPVDSSDRLEMMLSIDSSSFVEDESSGRYAELDQLYGTILAAAFNSRLERREKERRELVLWTVVCAREPMNVQTLASLLDLTERQISFALQPLQSVLHISTEGGLVSTLHASFPDYLVERPRSGTSPWHCNMAQHSEVLAQRCFDVMREKLRFNICNLESSFVFDKDVPDMGDRIKANIPPALFYACRYWGEHMRLAKASYPLCDKLVDFLTHRLLFWMEVLNLKQCITTGAPLLLHAKEWLLANDLTIDTLKSITDARSFVIRYAASACTRSTAHVYVSALPFCPKSSMVYAHYWERTKGLMCVKGTSTLGENALLATWNTGSANRAVACSPDGTRIASASDDKTIRVWDIRTGNVIAGPFEGHSASINSVAFSSDGTRIVSASDDMTIRVWDSHTGDIVAGPFKGHSNPVNSVAFSPDTTRVVSGSHDTVIIVWDSYTGDIVAGPFKGHSGSVNSIAFSPDGTRVVFGSQDGTVRVRGTRTSDIVAGPFKGHSGSVSSVAFSPDATRIVSGSQDGAVWVCDTRTGNLVVGPFQGHSNQVNSVAFSPNGTRIVSGSGNDGPQSGVTFDFTISVWDTQTGDMVAGPLQGHSREVTSVVFSPDGTLVISASSDKTLRVWDIHAGQDNAGPYEGHSDWVKSVAFSPDGTRIASGSDDKAILVWNSHTGDIVAGPFKRHSGFVNSVAFSPDGTRIVSGSSDGTIIVWDPHTGDIIAGPFKEPSGSARSVAFSPDGTRIVSVSGSGTVVLWHSYTGDVVAGPFNGHRGFVISVAFSPDGTRIVSGTSQGHIILWDSHTGDIIAGPFKAHSSSVYLVAFSPDGARIVSGSFRGPVIVSDSHTGDVIARSIPFQEHLGSVNSVAFSPDGTYIVSGPVDRSILVWDSTGKPVAGPFAGHSGVVDVVALSPDHTRIVSGDRDNVIRIWDMHPSHVTGLFDGQKWDLNDDGWVVSKGVPLFWVSPGLHNSFPRAPHSLVLGPQGSIFIEHWNLLLGNDWAKCYTA